MAWTKRDIVKQACTEIGKGDYEFDLSPETLQIGLRQLDAMAATWAAKGVRLGYNGANGFGDIDAESEVPRIAVEALFLNLAIRMAPSFGKTVAPETMASAKAAYDAVAAWSVTPRPRHLAGYAGSGSIYGNLPEDEEQLRFGRDGNVGLGR